MRKLFSVLATVLTGLLCWQLVFPNPVQAAPEDTSQVKELNFVFLHGAGGNPASLQPLSDAILDLIPQYINAYSQENPTIRITVQTLNRYYPNDVDLDTWAKNIVQSVDKYFNKKNFILVGHSMGGKAALYATANDIDGFANRVAAVVTINSPIKRLMDYYYAGGEAAIGYWGAHMMFSDRGVIDSAARYDSSEDGKWVATNKHWLALISAEDSPSNPVYDFNRLEPLPRDMDDGAIPISAQYSEGADVLYYGENGHSDFNHVPEIAEGIARNILDYIFAKPVQLSFFARSESLEHKANWLPLTLNWQDLVGEVQLFSGNIQHKNESYFKWQEWEDIVGEVSDGVRRSSYLIDKDSLPILTSVKEIRWLNPNDPQDCRLYIRTSAAPGCTVRADWNIYQQGALPAGFERDHYEVQINTGTPLTGVTGVVWASKDPQDLRLRISSYATGPFRWLKVKWSVYLKEPVVRNVIAEIQ